MPRNIVFRRTNGHATGVMGPKAIKKWIFLMGLQQALEAQIQVCTAHSGLEELNTHYLLVLEKKLAQVWTKMS